MITDKWDDHSVFSPSKNTFRALIPLAQYVGLKDRLQGFSWKQKVAIFSKSSNLRKIIIIIISNGCNPFKQLKCEDNQMVIIGNCPYCHVMSYKQAFIALTSEVVIGSFPNFHDMI